MPTREEEIAWAAGLFEGEGCVTDNNGRFTLRLVNTDEEVVRRFDDIVVWGLVYGPYRQDNNRDRHRRKPFWVWVSHGYNALDAFNLLSPWLSKRRLDRAFELSGIRFPGKSSPPIESSTPAPPTQPLPPAAAA